MSEKEFNQDTEALSHDNNEGKHEETQQGDRWGKVAKVISQKGSNGLWGVMVGLIVFLGIVFMMFSGSSHHKASVPASGSEDNDTTVLQENAKKLAELRDHQAPVHVSIPDPSIMPVSTETKAMVVRRNAPTQMYVSGKAPVVGGGQHGQQASLVGKGPFASFANQQSANPSAVVATRIHHPAFTIAQGEFIHAVLETAINSDLPGMVRAVVSRPVYAYTGNQPIIPAGSRLIGQYTAMNSNGAATTRVFVMWNRLITPSGISIMLNSPGSDALGRSGLAANRVNSHFWKIFGTASLLSVLGATTANLGVSPSDQPNSADSYRESVASGFQQASQSSLSQNLSIKPTIHIYQGNQITVFVAHDLDLYSALGGST